MNYPKVRFINYSIDTEIIYFLCFIFGSWAEWVEYIYKIHPELKKIKEIKTKKDRRDFIIKYIKETRGKKRQIMDKRKKQYQKDWNKIEKDFFKVSSLIINEQWPKKIIKGMISINKICPRFLNKWSFAVYYDYKKPRAHIEVIMHECIHFLYFKKWKKVFPKISKRKYEAPHIEWHLSELIAPIILNDKRIQKILKRKADFYSTHSKIKIKGVGAPQYFTKIYNKYINKEGFENFLKEAYKEIKIHKKLFDNF